MSEKFAKVSNVWEMAYLRGVRNINFVDFKSNGKRVSFYYDMTQEDMNKIISEYYASPFAKFSDSAEAIRTVIKASI